MVLRTLSYPTQVPLEVITEESRAKLFLEPMRLEILRLLSRRTYTAKELSETIGLSPPSIGHHLRALVKGQLISMTREEPESHGILQKWYQSNAQAFIVDREALSPYVRRYLMPFDLERARGIAACVSILKGTGINSTSRLESLTNQVCKSISRAAHGFKGQRESDPEQLIQRLYVDAIRSVI